MVFWVLEQTQHCSYSYNLSFAKSEGPACAFPTLVGANHSLFKKGCHIFLQLKKINANIVQHTSTRISFFTQGAASYNSYSMKK